jgi:tripartite-type tricarboxylate transporter receptor subunit TctC
MRTVNFRAREFHPSIGTFVNHTREERMISKLICSLVTTTAVLLASAAPAAETYPSKPIRLIVPFSPGGTNDILGRIIAQHMSEKLGQTMIVDNRTGFQGIIGTNLAAKAAPDGYTLVMISSAYTMNPVVYKMPYDTLTALDFIAKIGASFLILSVTPSLPVNSVGDLLAMAKKKPGHVTLGSSGGFQQFASELFKSVTNTDFNVILYKGGAPAMIDVMGGQVNANLAVSVPGIPHLRSGRLKGLAVGLPKRSELLPNIPTFEEAGVKGFDAANWYSIATAAGTPRPIVMKLYEELARFFNSPEMQKKMATMGAVVDIKSPDEMREIIPAELAKWTKVAIAAGMKRNVK